MKLKSAKCRRQGNIHVFFMGGLLFDVHHRVACVSFSSECARISDVKKTSQRRDERPPAAFMNDVTAWGLPSAGISSRHHWWYVRRKQRSLRTPQGVPFLVSLAGDGSQRSPRLISFLWTTHLSFPEYPSWDLWWLSIGRVCQMLS